MDKPTIYLVDDDETVRESLMWMLDALGVSARACEDPSTVPHDGAPGCVILDEVLAGNVSGLDSVDPSTGLLAGRPVVLFTGRADAAEVRSRAQARGVRHILAKPAQVSTLLAAVEAAMAEAS
jgi:two-component system, LuxR family, response regulator FixJ